MPAQMRAHVIADNQLAEDASWDDVILQIELQHLVFENRLDISRTGFEVPELDVILESEAVEDDSADELPAEHTVDIAKPGGL